MFRNLKRTGRWLAIAVTIGLLCSAGALAKKPPKPPGDDSAGYTIVPFLPPNFASVWSEVTDLNDQGHVVGVAGLESGGAQAVHLDLTTGVYTSLQDGWRAEGVNNLNQTVGVTETGHLLLAAFWSSPSAEPVPLLPLVGDVTSYALAVNDAGIVVGWSWDFVCNLARNVVWRVVVDENEIVHVDGPVELPPLNAGVSTLARDINRVVGGTAQVVGDSGNQAVVWTIELDPEYGTLVAPGAPTPVGTPGASWSIGWGINNLADVCGCMDSDSVAWDIPFAALAGQEAQPLDVPRGTLNGSANDINDRREIVGWVEVLYRGFKTGPGRLYAYLWKDGKSTDLNKEISPQSGWDLSEATVISNEGIIGGSGRFDVYTRGFVLIPNS